MDIIITGGAGTIGQASAKILLSQGYRPVLFDIDRDRVTQVATMLGVPWTHVDLSISKSVENAFSDYGDNLYGVVLAAGIVGPVGLLEDCRDEDFDLAMTVNVRSVWLGLKHALKALKLKGRGSIVVVSSLSGNIGSPMLSAYCATKHAVLGLVRAAAKESATSGVRVNAVCPGPVNSVMMKNIDIAMGRAGAEASVPMRRYAEPIEVAEAIAFLCSEKSAYMSGSTLMLDGAYSTR